MGSLRRPVKEDDQAEPASALLTQPGNPPVVSSLSLDE